jgi:hypothetical protein
MNDNVEKVDLNRVDWKSSREFFESLGEALNKLEDKDESYDFTWVGKRKSIIEAGAPIDKILRPDVEASKDFDNTKNMLIVGDNLDALKLLQESYLGKIKMIYIDPPYNTGHDFVYNDDFSIEKANYSDSTKDNDKNIIIVEDKFLENSKSNGRFHSDWLSMMYPRLKLAKNLLSESGVIFISIDDNEQANLKKICDEIFGEDNFVDEFVWRRSGTGGLRGVFPVTTHEYILCYARNKDSITRPWMAPYSESSLAAFTNEDENGKYKTQALYLTSLKQTKSQAYPIELPDGVKAIPPTGTGAWRFIEDTYKEELKNGNIVFKEVPNSPLQGINGEKVSYNIYTKQYISNEGTNPPTILPEDVVGQTRAARAELKKIFGKDVFSYAKPTPLIEYLVNLPNLGKESIVLDFFAGSGTSGHSVMNLNLKDHGSRQYIGVQLNENLDEAFDMATGSDKATIKNAIDYLDSIGRPHEISELTAERLKKCVDDSDPIDSGLRVFRIDDANEKDNIRKPLTQIKQSDLFESIDNVKKDRTPLDLLFGIIYTSALPFDLKLETRKIGENTVYMYGYLDENTGLIACFDDEVPEETVKEIAKLNPLTAAFKDSSFKDSAEKINLSEHFRIISPDTRVKVI